MSRDRAPDSTAGWRPRWAIARRELRSLRSEKTIILAICIQLTIAGFSSFLVVGLVSLYDPGASDDFETEVAITGEATHELFEASFEHENVEPTIYYDRGAAYDAFDRREVAAVLDSSRDGEGRLVVRVTAPDAGLGTTMVVVQLREYLQTVERSERIANVDRLESEPLALPGDVDASPYVTFTYTILLPLLCFLPVFISGSIAVDSLIEERQRATLPLLQVAPPSLADVIDAKLLATAMLAPIQAILWLLLLAVNGITVAYPTTLVAYVGAFALLVVVFALSIALRAPDRRQAQLLYSGGIVGLLFVTTLLPEHPANTIAKLALGTATTTTWALVIGSFVVATIAYGSLRLMVTGLDPEML